MGRGEEGEREKQGQKWRKQRGGEAEREETQWSEGAKAVVPSEVKVRPLCLALHRPGATNSQLTVSLFPTSFVMSSRASLLKAAQ